MKLRAMLTIVFMLFLVSSCNGSSGNGIPQDTNNPPAQTPLQIKATLYSADDKGDIAYDAELTSHLLVTYDKSGTDDVVVFTLNNVTNWTRLYMKVDYPVQFTYKSTRFGTLFDNSYLGSMPYEPGKVDVVIQMFGANPTGFTGSGEAVRITFSRKTGSSVSSERHTNAITDLTSKIVQTIEHKTGVPDSISWVEKLPGDASLNHAVDFSDFGVIGAHYNKSISTNPALEPVDTDGKGKIDFADFGKVGAYYNNKISGYALFTGNPPTTEVKRFTFDGKSGTQIPAPTKSAGGWNLFTVSVDWLLDQKMKIVPLDSTGALLENLGDTIDLAGDPEKIVPIELPTVSDTKLFGSRPGLGIQPQDGSVHIVQNSTTKGFRHFYFDSSKSAWLAESVTTDNVAFPAVFCPQADKKSLLEVIAFGYSLKEQGFVYYVKNADNGNVFGPMTKIVSDVAKCDAFDYVYNPTDGSGFFVFAGVYNSTYGAFSFRVIPGDEEPTLIGPTLIKSIDPGTVFNIGLVLEASGGARVTYIAGSYDAGTTPPTIDTKMYTTYLAAPLDGAWDSPVLVDMPSPEELPINMSTALHTNGYEDIFITTAKPYTVPLVEIKLLTSHIYLFNRTSAGDTITWGSAIESGGVTTQGFPLPSALVLTLPGLTLTHAFPDTGSGGRFLSSEYQVKTPVTWDGMTPKLGTPTINSLLANYRYGSSAWTADTNVTETSTIAPSVAYNPVWKKFCLVYINASLNPEDPMGNSDAVEGGLIYKTLNQ